jgi:hypothetical protein
LLIGLFKMNFKQLNYYLMSCDIEPSNADYISDCCGARYKDINGRKDIKKLIYTYSSTNAIYLTSSGLIFSDKPPVQGFVPEDGQKLVEIKLGDEILYVLESH